MPSPFPGMNPYLENEDAWHDFHERFIPTAAAMIGPQVGPNYIVKIDEQIYVHELFAEQRRLLNGGVDIEGQAVIEIRDRRSRKVMTVVELLNPSNKHAGPRRNQYVRRRGALLYDKTNLVEIDLLRGGQRMPMRDAWPRCDYCVVVSRVESRPRAEAWPIQLRDRLPVIPVPLHSRDPVVPLDLQEILHRVYDDADYKKYIYDELPEPPLDVDDAAWAAQFIPR